MLGDFAPAHINQSAIAKTAYSTPALVALDYLFMTKDASLREFLQFVTNLPRRLAHLPRLLVDRESEISVNLDDRLHD